MAHEIESIAYAGETPWHGLGNKVDQNATIEEMEEAAGLRWKLDRFPLYADIHGERVKVPNKFAFVRDTDRKIMTVAGPEWKPLQNSDALEFFREFAEAGKLSLHTAGALRGGQIVWALAAMNKGFTLNGRDQVDGYILLTSPHIVGKRISIMNTSVRVVCANTLRMAHNKEAEYSQTHLKEFDFTAAKDAVGLAISDLEIMEQQAKKLQEMELGDYDTMRFFAKYFHPKPEGADEEAHVKELLDEPKARDRNLNEVIDAYYDAPGATPGNGWGVLNAVTYWSDHLAGRSNDARLFSAWHGERAKLKSQVRDELYQMAA